MNSDEKKSAVQTYKFQSLIPNGNKLSEGIEDYAFTSLKDLGSSDKEIPQEVIRLEREFEAKSAFSINEVVRESRGLLEQEQSDYEKRVAEEVDKRLEAIKEESFQEGFSQGQVQGKEQAYEEAKKELDVQVEDFKNEIENAKLSLDSVYDQNTKNIYMMIKNLTKWIILKDLDEEHYLSRLLEKLILEMKCKTNLLIHVNRSSFDKMEGVISEVEKRIGQLTNVRVEVDLDQKKPGIVLEAENGIIDGSLESQFATLEKLFESVGLNAESAES